jgi:hypothetical protein
MAIVAHTTRPIFPSHRPAARLACFFSSYVGGLVGAGLLGTVASVVMMGCVLWRH